MTWLVAETDAFEQFFRLLARFRNRRAANQERHRHVFERGEVGSQKGSVAFETALKALITRGH